MQYLILENFFSNTSFVFLFVTMLFYWIRTIFFPESWNYTNKSNRQSVKSSERTISSISAQGIAGDALSKVHGNRFGTFCILICNLSLAGQLVCRWIISNHFPLSNLYESLIFLSWGFTLSHILLEKIMSSPLIGSILAPSALLTSSFAYFVLPETMKKATPLVPALQSNWLMMHVTIMILSYAALIAGCLLSIMFLVLNSTYDPAVLGSKAIESTPGAISKNTENYNFNTTVTSIDANTSYPISNDKVEITNLSDFNFQKGLDNISYRSLSIGFSLLTIGIISGAVWANQAWGSYWSWDPKETWALITWLIFATYLHTRLNYGWEGKKPAFIASGGFFIIWVCYFGVNLFGKGLHNYGFWN
uniref:Cytochrome c biogenesis protein CcsA n=1 Tax=Neodangemannia microcystis TaxID=173495 RepID=A0A1W6EH38_9CHLO|nr:heme attachment to plastid cytochrome c [Neodangemannia microcystis]ARK14734.1 heme attachment to plastid cytochrome c [Neodangemannia microcystis]